MPNLCKESFVMYRSHIDAINDIENDLKRLEIYDAIFEFALDGENEREQNLNGISRTIFKLIKPQLEANNRKYLNGKKGAASGGLGGRPKKPLKNPKETPRKPLENPLGVIGENPKETPNVNENVNVNVNVNGNKSSKDNLLKKEKSKKKNQEEELKIPEWLDKNLWYDYLEMRKKIKKPAIKSAQNLILRKLEGFERENIGDGTLSLKNSIERSYQGVFRPKEEDRANNIHVDVVNKRPQDAKQQAKSELNYIIMRCQNLHNEVGEDYITDSTYREIIKEYGGAFKFARLVRSDSDNQKKTTYNNLVQQYLEAKSQNDTMAKETVDTDNLSVNNCY